MEKIAILAAVEAGTSRPISPPQPGVGAPALTTKEPQAGYSAPPAARISAFAVMWLQKDRVMSQIQEAVAQRQTLIRIEDSTRAIEREITALVKNYPPFPYGSEERLSYLRSISALRQQLDALIVPPKPTWPGQFPILPPLPTETASDAEWLTHLQSLSRYRDELEGLQQELAEVIELTPLWPGVGDVAEAAFIQAMTLPETVRGLAASALSLGQDGALVRAGLA